VRRRRRRRRGEEEEGGRVQEGDGSGTQLPYHLANIEFLLLPPPPPPPLLLLLLLLTMKSAPASTLDLRYSISTSKSLSRHTFHPTMAPFSSDIQQAK